MARLALGIVGGVAGAFIGGPAGFSIGFTAGSFLGSLVEGPQKLPPQYGPRLSDRGVQSSAFGQHINVLLGGMDRIAGQIIFASNMKTREHKKKVRGGKGFGGTTQSQVTFTHSYDLMISFGKGPKGIRRVWADTMLIYDASDRSVEAIISNNQFATNTGTFTVRNGSADQKPSALEESYFGAGQVSAHRNLFCIESADFPIDNYGRIPNFTAELFNEGDDTLTLIDSVNPFPEFDPHVVTLNSWSYVDNGEITVLGVNGTSGAPAYSGSRYVVNRMTPDGAVVDAKVPEIDALGQAITPASHGTVPFFGHADQPAYFFFNQVFVARAGYAVRLVIPVGAGDPNYWTLSGNEIVTYMGFSLSPTQKLVKYDASSGNSTLVSTALTAANGYERAYGLDFSDSFYYALCPNSAVTTVYLAQLDRATLAVIQQWDLGNTDFIALSVKSDSEIYLARCFGTSFPTEFYRFDTTDGSKVLLGTAFSNLSPPGFTNNMIYSQGIFYCQAGPNTVGGSNNEINRVALLQSTEDTVLWKLVRDICGAVGLDAPVGGSPPSGCDIEVGELLDVEHGYTITREMTAREAVLKLQEARFFDIRESNLKLEFIKRGHDPVAEIDGATWPCGLLSTSRFPTASK
jgi:hypothetical protein